MRAAMRLVGQALIPGPVGSSGSASVNCCASREAQRFRSSLVGLIRSVRGDLLGGAADVVLELEVGMRHRHDSSSSYPRAVGPEPMDRPEVLVRAQV